MSEQRRKQKEIRKSFGDRKGGKDGRRQTKDQRKKGQSKWKSVVAEIDSLKNRIEAEVPPSGILYYKYTPKSEDGTEKVVEHQKVSRHKVLETDDKTKIKIRFSDLPISKCSVSGLFKSKFIKMTEVQRASIPHALQNRDLTICARTGSGKTLAYLIPIVERLYRERWTQLDGLGALVLVPTRELAMQAFEVLRSFAGLHDLSAALVIGGRDVQLEK